MPTYTNLFDGLKNIEDGRVPETRMEDASSAHSIITKALSRDREERDIRRARLKGMVDGNPPYKKSDLRAAGRADECNVNWRISKYFLTLAQGMCYDVMTQAETLATVTLDCYKLEEKLKDRAYSKQEAVEWGRGITEEFDRLQKRGDSELDYHMQLSQGQSCFYGAGPLHFEDRYDFRPCALENRMLLLPDLASANPKRWEWCALIVEYTPTNLFARIMDPEHAPNWKVAATRKAIMSAHEGTGKSEEYNDWMYHQNLLKTGSYDYNEQAKKITCGHLYYREFPRRGEEDGKISHAIIDLNTETAGDPEYLYFSHREYENWTEIIHPMYWQQDISGLFHAVSGLGIEMFAALEYENRLLCRIADDAFAPKIFLRPTTPAQREKSSIAAVGRYAYLPAAFDVVQQNLQSNLQEGIAMSREVQALVSSNLSQYRSQALQKTGNPATATQINYEASEQAKMGATQLSRIYEQYDWLYAEKFRRAANRDLPEAARSGPEIREFHKRCKRRGIPAVAFDCIEQVRATRVVGQGSAFLRQQSLEFLLGLLQILPEGGREPLVRDVIAARAGQSHVDRYWPRADMQDTRQQSQESDAMQQVAAMKVGIPPVMVGTQNPMIYLAIFLETAEAAAKSIQEGAPPAEPLAFIQIALPAIQAHLQRLAGDRTRLEALKPVIQRFRALGAFAQKVAQEMSRLSDEQRAAMAQAQQIGAGRDPETIVGLAKVEANARIKGQNAAVTAALKARKQAAELELAARRTAGEMALADAETAHDIRLSNLKQ